MGFLRSNERMIILVFMGMNNTEVHMFKLDREMVEGVRVFQTGTMGESASGSRVKINYQYFNS